MKGFERFSLVLMVLIVTPLVVHAQAWSGIISTTRATDWSQAGLPGDVPPDASWTQCGPTISPYGSSGSYASPSTINNALNHTGSGYTSCGAHTYILLGAGDFYLNGAIQFGSTSYDVLRGAGPNVSSGTRLHFSSAGSCNGFPADICVTGSNSSQWGGVTDANWTSGYAQNSTTITLSTIGGAIVGVTPIILDQCNTGYTGNSSNDTCTGAAVDNGQFFVCDQPGASQAGGSGVGCETETQSNNYWPLRSQEEVVTVTQCDGVSTFGHVCSSGSNITISPGVRAPNWSAAFSPKAHVPVNTVVNSGVENVYLDNHTAGQEAIVMMTCHACWVNDIASYYGNGWHVQDFFSSHDAILNSYFYWTLTAGDKSYGVGGFDSGDLLVENNIMQGITDPINYDGPCPGCVAAYNYAVNDYYGNTSYLFAMVSFHSAGQNDILLEGNIGVGGDQDQVHGYHDMNTFFRNQFWGMAANNGVICSNGAAGSCFNHSAVHLAGGARYANVIGNVLGTPTYDTAYECVGPASLSPFTCANQSFSVYDLGYGGQTQGESDFDNTPPNPNDPLVPATMLLWGNYDSVHAAAQWNSSEVPTAAPAYPNSVPSTHTLPPSFYDGLSSSYPSCGTGLAFWKNPTTGTCPPFPPIGPDVAAGSSSILRCTSGQFNYSRVLSASQCAGGTSTPDDGGFAAANPAMVCYLNQMGGTPDGTGNMLTFNPTACYTSDGGGSESSGTPPTAPTNLTATVD